MEVGKPWRVCLIQEENLAFFVYPKYTPNIRTGEKAAKIQLPLVCVYIYIQILYTHIVYIYTSISSIRSKKRYCKTWFKWQLYAWPRGFTITWDLVGSQTPKKPHSCWFVTPIFRFIWFYIDLRSSKNLQVSNWQPYACGVETSTLGETAQK